MGWVAVLDTNKAIGGIWPAKATEGLDIGFKYCMAWEAFMVGVSGLGLANDANLSFVYNDIPAWVRRVWLWGGLVASRQFPRGR